MKSLWNIVSFMAVVHLLALLIFIGWLWQSQRLDRDRIGDLRTLLATPVPQAKDAASKNLLDAQAERFRKAQEDQKQRPMLDSEAQIQRITLITQQEDQTRRRLQDEKSMLQQ